jgi:hypothetical protein
MAEANPQPPEPPRKRQKSIPAGFDLRGRPNVLSEHMQRKIETIVVRPVNLSNANINNFWTFQFRARKNQWIRLKPDALTVQVWGRMNNPNRVQVGSDERKAEHWALRAKDGNPQLFVDPTVQATGFIKGVDVFINNVQVPTNGALNNHLIHYTRVSRLFENNLRDKTFFGLHSDITFERNTKEMTEATKMFHYQAWNSSRGVRTTVFLDGIFPFDCRNKTIQTIDNEGPFEAQYFPPETSFEIRVHLHKDKCEALFHQGMADYGTSYYASDPANVIPNAPVLTFQDVSLEYESTELIPAEHVKAIQKFESGSVAHYSYDIPRIQYQSLPAEQSFTTNTFQIQPMARLFYLLFTPNWGTFVMDAKRKPLSGFSTFPRGATKIQLSFGSDTNLIHDHFEDFGIRGTQHQISKRIYYNYLSNLKIFPGTFEQLFPSNATDISTLQMFVYDLQTQKSQKTELLTIQCTFGQGDTSPSDTQIMCISVHETGRATCTFNNHSSDYIWSFNHTS